MIYNNSWVNLATNTSGCDWDVIMRTVSYNDKDGNSIRSKHVL